MSERSAIDIDQLHPRRLRPDVFPILAHPSSEHRVVVLRQAVVREALRIGRILRDTG